MPMPKESIVLAPCKYFQTPPFIGNSFYYPKYKTDTLCTIHRKPKGYVSKSCCSVAVFVGHGGGGGKSMEI